MLLTRRTHRTQQIHTRTHGWRSQPGPSRLHPGTPQGKPVQQSTVASRASPAHPQPGPRNGWEGAGGAAGEAGLGPGRARRVRGGPRGLHGEVGPGQLKDTCGLRGARREPQGSPHLPSASPQVGNTGAKEYTPPSGGSAPPGATVPIPGKGGSVPPLSPISSSEGLADTCAGPGGVGVRPGPQPRSPPCPVFPGGPPLTAEPQGRGAPRWGVWRPARAPGQGTLARSVIG